MRTLRCGEALAVVSQPRGKVPAVREKWRSFVASAADLKQMSGILN
ncbi:MAG: hypothetical protein KI793_04340 [Rivularia sp. (in: Bacteria)]|nr:hypothetical protein [Rivularia sp. MS3]